jgi:hypothetical protein
VTRKVAPENPLAPWRELAHEVESCATGAAFQTDSSSGTGLGRVRKWAAAAAALRPNETHSQIRRRVSLHSPVDLLAITDLIDDGRPRAIVHIVDNARVADSHAELTGAPFDLLSAARAWIMRKAFNSSHNSSLGTLGSRSSALSAERAQLTL